MHDQRVDIPRYRESVGTNIRVLRARNRLSQKAVADQMRELGIPSWLPQTCGEVERGKRSLKAEEILGLALVFGTSMTSITGAVHG